MAPTANALRALPAQGSAAIGPQRRRSFDAYELIGGVEHTELCGHDAAHFVSSFTVGGDPTGLTRGVARAVVAENWIVKRGRYFFILESMAPRKDASRGELRAIVESIVIEARDY